MCCACVCVIETKIVSSVKEAMKGGGERETTANPEGLWDLIEKKVERKKGERERDQVKEAEMREGERGRASYKRDHKGNQIREYQMGKGDERGGEMDL